MRTALTILLVLLIEAGWAGWTGWTEWTGWADWRRSQHPVVKPAVDLPAVDLSEGRRLFLENCSACHGDNAKGGRGPDLTSGAWKHGGSNAEIIRNTLKGIPGTQMPAIPLSEVEAGRIVSFLRSLSRQSSDSALTGEVEAGRRLFFNTARCAECHMFGGRGDIRASDLTDLRSRSDVGRITRQMANPIRMARVRLAAGQMLDGLVKGEDTFNLRLLDQQRRWHLLDKRVVRATEYTLPHPQLGALGGKEQADLLAFLLRSEQRYEPDPAWRPAAGFNVSFDRLRKAPAEPQNWLTYWGDLRGHHYSGLQQITPANIGRLHAAWTAQLGGTTIETTPLVVDGMMFVTGPLNNVTALDARTGQVIWRYTRRLPAVASHCTVMTNRGLAILGDRLYLATLDMHLIALDARSGNIIWDVVQDDYRLGISNTHAPLAIDGKIIVGVTAGECALTGFIDAFDAATGRKLWRTRTIPEPGDPNRQTWIPASAADYGGAPTWMTGTYDSELRTIYWMTGNPGPDYDGTVRGGDNLYSCSVVALDEATGRMKWWFQFTPHDVHDWDANETPVLIDGLINGKRRRLLVTAQRNAFYYVLDRETGEFITGQAFAKQTWARGLDARGRPIIMPNTAPTPGGNRVCPDAAGAANWGSPSYDSRNGQLLVSVRETCATYTSVTKSPVPGQGYTGGGVEVDPGRAPGFIRAIEALTGKVKWSFPIHTGASSTGVVATAGGVAFASSNDGHLIALNQRTGAYLWHYYTGAPIVASPISYAVDGRQYVAIAAQSAIFTFRLD